jgi:phosphofructokinase-like protein
MTIRKIALNTGGGDAPGLNAVIRAAVLSALRRGWEVVGIRRGYDGLLKNELLPLDRTSVRGITHIGGTILGTTNRGDPFAYPSVEADGKVKLTDVSDRVVSALKDNAIDALIAIGGDGSLRIAHQLSQKGVRVVGVPKTIDNDLTHTVVTFGFDTAVSIATEALDRLHSTAEAHDRVMVVELMGRYAGWIALNAGVAATADVIVIPEIPYNIDSICRKILDRERQGRRFSIVVAAEGAQPVDGGPTTRGRQEPGRQEPHLGGVADRLAAEIKAGTGKDTRTVVLGHLQRGGTPSTFDRLLALRFGAAAVRALALGLNDVMVALDPPVVRYVDLKSAIERQKTVPLECDTIETARELGICFGDD